MKNRTLLYKSIFRNSMPVVQSVVCRMAVTLLIVMAWCLSLPAGAQTAGTGIENLWSSRIDNADAGSSSTDGQFIKSADGTYIGIFTTGAGAKYYEGRIVKFSAAGEQLWEKEIQPAQYTSVKKVCESSDGNIYVAGTTDVDGTTRAWVSSFAQDGSARGTRVFETAFSQCVIDDIQPYKEGVAVFYTGITTGKIGGHYHDVLASDLSVTSEKERRVQDSNISVLYNVFIEGDWVLASTQNDYTCFNLATGEIKNTKTGSFEGGCKYGKDFYLIQKGDKAYTVIKLSIGDNGPKTAWTTEVDFETSYYLSDLFAASDGNLYFVKKGASFYDMAELNTDGDIVKKKTSVWIDEKANGGFVYSLDTDKDGNILIAGHADDFKVFYATLDKDFTIKKCTSSVISDDFKYAYSYEKMSSFVDGKLLMCGFLRTADLLGPYTQFFTVMDAEKDFATDWKKLYEPGRIPYIFPMGGTFDKEGNAYMAVISDRQPYAIKYDNNGKQLWSEAIKYEKGTKGYSCDALVLDNGNVIIAGYTENDNDYQDYINSLIACFGPDGKQLWVKQTNGGDLYISPKTMGLYKTTDGNFIVVSQAIQKGTYTQCMAVEKFDAEGNVLFTKVIALEKDFMPNRVRMDDYGNILAAGYSYGSDYTRYATVEKISQDGELTAFLEDKNVAKCEFNDAWTDKDGRIYAAGYTEKNGFYAVFDADGKEISYEQSADLGYWQAVSGNSKEAVLTGTFGNSSNITIGKVVALSTTDGKTKAWEMPVQDNDAAQTFALGVLASDKNIIVTGYTEDDGKQVSEYVLNCDVDGKNIQKNTSSAIDNRSESYSPMFTFGSSENFVTLSRFALDQYIYMGYARCYKVDDTNAIKPASYNSKDGLAIRRNGDALAVTGAGNSNVSMSIYTSAGKLLRLVNGPAFNMASLPEGIYVIKAQCGNITKTLKVVK